MELVVRLVPSLVIEKKGDVTEYSIVYKEEVIEEEYYREQKYDIY